MPSPIHGPHVAVLCKYLEAHAALRAPGVRQVIPLAGHKSVLMVKPPSREQGPQQDASIWEEQPWQTWKGREGLCQAEGNAAQNRSEGLERALPLLA